VAARKTSILRIVSLAPSATSILCAIGVKKALVGVTKWCADVAPVGSLAQLGDCWHLDRIAEILALRPTLVIGSVPYKQETVAKLLEQPINFLAMNPRTLADIEADIRLLGGIAGREKAAAKLVENMRREFEMIRRKAKTKPGKSKASPRIPRVYCEAWANPRISSPPWVAELVAIAGGTMVVAPGERVRETQVADAQPDVIILAWAATGDKSDPAQAYKVEAWKNLPAIRNKRVYVVRDELLNTPGPPLVAGAKQLYNFLKAYSSSGLGR
jgi:iron complex transport system substrate-binding protein